MNVLEWCPFFGAVNPDGCLVASTDTCHQCRDRGVYSPSQFLGLQDELSVCWTICMEGREFSLGSCTDFWWVSEPLWPRYISLGLWIYAWSRKAFLDVLGESQVAKGLQGLPRWKRWQKRVLWYSLWNRRNYWGWLDGESFGTYKLCPLAVECQPRGRRGG